MKKLIVLALLGASINSIWGGAAAGPDTIKVTNDTKLRAGIITNLWLRTPSYLLLAPGQSGSINAPKMGPPAWNALNKPVIVFLTTEDSFNTFRDLLNTKTADEAYQLIFQDGEKQLPALTMVASDERRGIDGNAIILTSDRQGIVIGRTGSGNGFRLVKVGRGRNHMTMEELKRYNK